MSAPTKAERVGCADDALKAFIARTGCDREDSLADLLCDLMHWADICHLSFAEALYRARYHYSAELAEGGAPRAPAALHFPTRSLCPGTSMMSPRYARTSPPRNAARCWIRSANATTRRLASPGTCLRFTRRAFTAHPRTTNRPKGVQNERPLPPPEGEARQGKTATPKRVTFKLVIEAQEMVVDYKPNWVSDYGQFEFRSPHKPPRRIPASGEPTGNSGKAFVIFAARSQSSIYDRRILLSACRRRNFRTIFP